MKKKLVESIQPEYPESMKYGTTVQTEKDILIINVFHNGILKARHCVNVETGEYMTLREGRWKVRMIDDALGNTEKVYGYYPGGFYNYDSYKKMQLSKSDIQKIGDALGKKVTSNSDAYWQIRWLEEEYGRNRREITEQNRIQKVEALMRKIPEIPEDIKEWIDQRETGGEEYAIKDRDTGKWSCSSCGEFFEKEQFQEKGKKLKDRDMIQCPKCGKRIRYLSRKRKIEIVTAFALVQPIDEEISVVRHFDVLIQCDGGRKKIGIDEAVRIIMRKDWALKILGKEPATACSIYYNQSPRFSYYAKIPTNNQWFDNKTNRANRSMRIEHLYDGGIEEAVKGTLYEGWSRIFNQMAAGSVKANYNRLMLSKDQSMKDLIEMLFKGRFRTLIKETSNNISVWTGGYCGDLRLSGHTIEDVFGIGDRQKINRIRDKDGGERMLSWMQWSDRHKTKISDKALAWLTENHLSPDDMAWINCRFSIEQAMNYVERQKRESYKCSSTGTVILQYEDYMSMCEKLKKDTTDALIYKPRDLKRRHDEAVAEIDRRNAEIKAEEYSKKFGEAEQVLNEIREKYEYSGDEYFIMVPQRIVDIVVEGRYLHHCAGATDRYFDRIKQHETYICFLRKIKEPDVPFYTIEVEPGGTIRQHRGMFDEEPDIEKVKPFLREWQKEIRKRMSKRDHELAAVSKVKREENIKELQEKNNTRVLNGLMEDFMEAVG